MSTTLLTTEGTEDTEEMLRDSAPRETSAPRAIDQLTTLAGSSAASDSLDAHERGLWRIVEKLAHTLRAELTAAHAAAVEQLFLRPLALGEIVEGRDWRGRGAKHGDFFPVEDFLVGCAARLDYDGARNVWRPCFPSHEHALQVAARPLAGRITLQPI